jgi:uncharacterized membrane protein
MFDYSLMDLKKLRHVYLGIVILSIIALAFSIIILIQKTSYNPAIDNFCTALNSQSQCEAVQQSLYAKTFGIDNPWFGIFGFVLLIIFAGLNYLKENRARTRLIAAGGVFAGALALYFLYLQSFILKQYCVFCVIVDLISVILLLASFYLTYKEYN